MDVKMGFLRRWFTFFYNNCLETFYIFFQFILDISIEKEMIVAFDVKTRFL